LAKYLAGIEQQEATRALARLAVYSEDGEVRRLAIEGLKKRARVDFADILWEGLSYPWPTVATNAANAIAKLRHVDLVPKLVDLLEQPDPSAPVWREVQGKKVPVIRELVRINHHRNCLLCHPPGTNPEMRDGTPFASIPMPDLPLPSQSGGYFMMLSPDILVQIDTTYLRQDFSRYQKVPDAAPWPTLQRFDFLVRTRVLNSNELGQYRKLQEERKRSPHQEATLAALRGLTGLDAGVSADSWRQRINQAKNESTVGSGKGKD
jgi:hypothetical protein